MPAPSTQALLTQWDWEPSIVLGILILTAVYAYAAGPWRRRHLLPPVTRGQKVFFALALATLVIALLSPLDYIGDEFLFSGHMVQHLLLASLWPVFMLLALPDWMVHPLFESRVAPLARALTTPLLALTLFNLDIYVWHFPWLYDLTLTNEAVHIVEHLTFMALGLLNFWPILSPIPEQRLSYPVQVLYLFVDGMLMMALGIVLTFSPIVFYTPYLSAPRLWGMSHLTDQQLGGLIMWYPGNIPYGVLLIAAFYRWFDAAGPAPQYQSPAETEITPQT